ncbi:MAG TPA: DNA-formamidopyrimidine glycosylase, partial [Anaerolineae bacterium]|nr:DNA-formamidopyrimidine glycosylase [Anaerolineae bacterium]
TVVRAIRPNLLNRTITDYQNNWARRIQSHPNADTFRAQIVGQRIVDVKRRAKHIILTLSDDYLLIHLRMTGHLSVVSAETQPDKYVHDIFSLDDGTALHFRDMRKFGTVALLTSLDGLEAKLGPEPLEDDFTVAVFVQQLGKRKTKLKPLLLDQAFVAGIGNIYADEALFLAKLAPTRTADSLNSAEIAALHAAIRHVLFLGVEREGASITNYVKPDGTKGDMQNAVMVFRRTGFPCYDCGTPIQRIKLAQRSTHFCPNCQVEAREKK